MHANNIKLVQVVLQACMQDLSSSRVSSEEGIRVFHGTHIEICHADNIEFVQVILQPCSTSNAMQTEAYKTP